MTVQTEFFGFHCEGLTHWDYNNIRNGWPGDYTHNFLSYRIWDEWDATNRFPSGIYWRNLNPSRGTFDWRHLDEVLRTLNLKGILPQNIVFTFGFVPRWANNSDDPARPPTNFADFETFVRALLAHVGTKIGIFELWNEPNDWPYDNGYYWKGTPAQLADMTLRAAKTIHAANPSAKVLSPSIQGNGGDWLGEYFDGGGADLRNNIDGIAVHYYEIPQFRSLHENTLSNLSGRGINKPFYLTEWGYGDGADVSAAAYIAKGLLYSAAYGFVKEIWYSPDDSEGTGGLVKFTSNGTPTTPNSAAYAYDRAYTWLIGKNVGPVAYSGSGGRVKKIVLSKTGWEGLAAWNDNGSSSMSIPAGKYKTFLVPTSNTVATISSSATSITINRTPKLLSTSTTWPV